MTSKTIAGKSPFQYWADVRKKSFEKQKARKAESGSKIKPWFDYWVKNCDERCENCGERISKGDRDGVYAAQAHIVPKSLFPSVADVIDNHATLGGRCGCHSRYDNLGWSTSEQMPVWPKIVERFKTFAHLIAPEERRRLPDSLRQYCP